MLLKEISVWEEMHQSSQMYLCFCFQILDREFLEQYFYGFDDLSRLLISSMSPLVLFGTLKQTKCYGWHIKASQCWIRTNNIPSPDSHSTNRSMSACEHACVPHPHASRAWGHSANSLGNKAQAREPMRPSPSTLIPASSKKFVDWAHEKCHFT